MANLVRKDQGAEEFVRAIEKIEKSSIRVFESLLYFKHLSKSKVKLLMTDFLQNELHEGNAMLVKVN